MNRLRRLLDSRYLLWVLLVLPGAWMIQGYIRGTHFYGELMHASGDLGAQLLIVALAITPLRVAFPRAGWPLWLTQRRRYIGVAAFGYSLLHAAVYVQRLGSLSDVAAAAAELGMLAGWLALAIMLPLALTSNNWSMRKLRRRWKTLHRFVYGAAVLTLAHWFLLAFDPVPGLIYFGLLAALQVLRLWRGRIARRGRVT